jgi:hypothetical protein
MERKVNSLASASVHSSRPHSNMAILPRLRRAPRESLKGSETSCSSMLSDLSASGVEFRKESTCTSLSYCGGKQDTGMDKPRNAFTQLASLPYSRLVELTTSLVGPSPVNSNALGVLYKEASSARNIRSYSSECLLCSKHYTFLAPTFEESSPNSRSSYW